MEDTVKQDLNALIKKYDAFIANTLKPSLKKELDERDLIFNHISEYQKLKVQIDTIKDNDLQELKTMVDLGSQFFVQAHIPDTKYIYVNVGFGFHVQFTLKEALAFIQKKEAQLQKSHPILQRPIDWILFVYFVTHIPITIFFDLQCLYPQWLIPQFLIQLNGSYLQLTSDPFMNTSNNIYWFKSFALCEAFIQLPFFFIACHGLLKNKSWIRLPLAIYGAHVMTTVIPCLAEIVFNQEIYGLSNIQRNIIFFLYFPYFLIPFVGLVDSSIRITKRLGYIDKQLALKKDT
ncbi:hypothetical protein BDF21DRAFT_379071 [Thamnidium elegans]|nr:hypothetical protein BDF21DRAFT_379071 [Thamnidium elegans]